MYLVGTKNHKYTVYGFDVFNSLAAVELFSIDYRVGLERERASTLLIMQSPALYIIPFGLNFRDYITRLVTFFDAFIQSFTVNLTDSQSTVPAQPDTGNSTNNSGNLTSTIWNLLKSYMYRVDESGGGDPSALIRQKIQLYNAALSNNLRQINDIFLVNRFARFEQTWFNMLTIALSGLGKHFPVFLLEATELIVRDGITNTVTETVLERVIEQIPERARELFIRGAQASSFAKIGGVIAPALFSKFVPSLGQAIYNIFNKEETNQQIGIDQDYNGRRIIINAYQDVNATSQTLNEVQNIQQNSTTTTQNQSEETNDPGFFQMLLSNLAQLMVVKRLDLPRRWDDSQRSLQLQVTITLSANNLFEYITNIMAPILYLQMLASPTQEAGGIGRMFIETPTGVTVLIPGKALIPFAIIDSFQYQLDPINQANTGHSLNATVTISFTDLLGTFVAPRTSSERAQFADSELFNSVTSIIIGSLYKDPVKEVLYKANDWLSQTDESKYQPVKRLLYGDNLFYNINTQEQEKEPEKSRLEKLTEKVESKVNEFFDPKPKELPPNERLKIRTNIPNHINRIYDLSSKIEIVKKRWERFRKTPKKPSVDELVQDARYVYQLLTELKTEHEQVLNELNALEAEAQQLLTQLPENSPERAKLKELLRQVQKRKDDVNEALRWINRTLTGYDWSKLLNKDSTEIKNLRDQLHEYLLRITTQIGVPNATQATKTAANKLSDMMKLITPVTKETNVKKKMNNSKL